jgi:hypothetical protein
MVDHNSEPCPSLFGSGNDLVWWKKETEIASVPQLAQCAGTIVLLLLPFAHSTIIDGNNHVAGNKE